MATSQNARRFYIDQEDDRAVVRTVPVRRTEPAPAPVTSPATHQVTPAQRQVHHAHFPRISPRQVTNLLRTARKRPHHHTS